MVFIIPPPKLYPLFAASTAAYNNGSLCIPGPKTISPGVTAASIVGPEEV